MLVALSSGERVHHWMCSCEVAGREQWHLSEDLERVTCALVAHSKALRKKEKRKKRKRRRRRKMRYRSGFLYSLLRGSRVGVWVLLGVFLRGISWETASGFTFVLSFAWFDSGYMYGVGWCVSTAPCTWQLLVRCWFCLRSTDMWIILGDHFQIVPCSALSGSRLIHTSVCLRRPGGSHALLREGGPRILILRSIPSCAGG